MKKILSILGIVVFVAFLMLVIIPQINKDKRLSGINPSNFGIKYGTVDKWIDSGINAKNIKKISVLDTENSHEIQIELDSNGQKILKDITSNNIGKQAGVFVRGKAISAPTINQAMDTPFIFISAASDEEALILKEDILDESPNLNAFYTVKTVGNSMEEYGRPEGQDARIYYNQKCMPGDNCSFQCLVDKCVCSSSECVHERGNKYLAIKRLVSIKNDCYWFEGNSKSIIDGNIEYKSFDSRTYGCLKASEFLMEGVVK